MLRMVKYAIYKHDMVFSQKDSGLLTPTHPQFRTKGSSPRKETVIKGTLSTSRRGGSTPVPFLCPNLPDSQITQKWTFDTTI